MKKISVIMYCIMFSFSWAGETLSVPPEMFASWMAKSLEATFPKTFYYNNLSLVVTKVYTDKNRVYFLAKTQQYKQIVQTLKNYHTLPDELKKQCRDFSKIALVDRGVEYIVLLEEKNEKSIAVLYDKLACNDAYDVQKKIFFDGYNRYGLSIDNKNK